MNAEPLDGAPQDLAAGGVDLTRHEARRDLDDVGLEAEIAHRLGGLEPEQSAADDGRAARARRPGADRVEILDRAIDEHAGKRRARDRRHERR